MNERSPSSSTRPREILRRVMPLASVFNAFGDDPEIADFYQLSGRLQRDGYRVVVDALARKRPAPDRPQPRRRHDDSPGAPWDRRVPDDA